MGILGKTKYTLVEYLYVPADSKRIFNHNNGPIRLIPKRCQVKTGPTIESIKLAEPPSPLRPDDFQADLPDGRLLDLFDSECPRHLLFDIPRATICPEQQRAEVQSLEGNNVKPTKRMIQDHREQRNLVRQKEIYADGFLRRLYPHIDAEFVRQLQTHEEGFGQRRVI